ncbi:DEAD-box ATP-dependent RNA helicase 47B [Tetrabaena socialis]|uniref:DEAD-box ATP-dependent RNA helicase 47B n=1 Tax=Tetrabaena socialis TaxID=47790 RepID=A0A2J8AFP9_9CHLO|nr:DEAD-box ATP-dependent RNA helicase 47B [Tetrabaena socialis]|eukprot:PNH11344.1 DEAD-box ATP-dependent RNA helicase 47B [Tetrabaena socialis]
MLRAFLPLGAPRVLAPRYLSVTPSRPSPGPASATAAPVASADTAAGADSAPHPSAPRPAAPSSAPLTSAVAAAGAASFRPQPALGACPPQPSARPGAPLSGAPLGPASSTHASPLQVSSRHLLSQHSRTASPWCCSVRGTRAPQRTLIAPAAGLRHQPSPWLTAARSFAAPAAGFGALGLNAGLQERLRALGMEEPLPVQAAAVPAILRGSNVAIKSCTGSGKTLAYLLPILQLALERRRAAEVAAAAAAVTATAAAAASAAGVGEAAATRGASGARGGGDGGSSAAELKQRQRSLQVSILHGQLSKLERGNILEAFRRGTFRALVATDLGARGLDLPDCDAVINFGPPADALLYCHRAGRTGRAGAPGVVASVVTRTELPRLRAIADKLGLTLQAASVSHGAIAHGEVVSGGPKTGRRSAAPHPP